MKIYRPEELIRIENPTPEVRHRLKILTEEANAKALAGHFSILFPGGGMSPIIIMKSANPSFF